MTTEKDDSDNETESNPHARDGDVVPHEGAMSPFASPWKRGAGPMPPGDATDPAVREWMWNRVRSDLNQANIRLIRLSARAAGHEQHAHMVASQRIVSALESALGILGAKTIRPEVRKDASELFHELERAAKAYLDHFDNDLHEDNRPNAAVRLRNRTVQLLAGFLEDPDRDTPAAVNAMASKLCECLVSYFTDNAHWVQPIALDLPADFNGNHRLSAAQKAASLALWNLDPDGELNDAAASLVRAILKALGYPDKLATTLFRQVRNREA
jgi:hypothetical protein